MWGGGVGEVVRPAPFNVFQRVVLDSFKFDEKLRRRIGGGGGGGVGGGGIVSRQCYVFCVHL